MDGDYIAKVHLLLLKVDVWRIIRTLGKEFHLENLSISGVHANIEKPNAKIKEKNSNIEYIINHLDAMGLIPTPEELAKQAEEEKKKAEEEKKKAEAAKAAAKAAGKAEDKKAADMPKLEDIPRIILGKIEIKDIGAGVSIRGVKLVGTISFHPTIRGFTLENIQRDVFGGREDLPPAQVVACVVTAIAKQIAKVVFEEIPGAVASATKEGAKAVVGNVIGGASSVAVTAKKGIGRIGRTMTSFLFKERTGTADDMSDGSASPPGSPQAGARLASTM